MKDFLRKRDDKAYWAEQYLGIRPPNYLTEWDRDTANATKRLLLAPVGHGKSWEATRIQALHAIVHDPNIRILIVSKSYEQALNDARMLKIDIETNKKLKADYGIEPSEPWNDSGFTVKRTKNLKEPTVSVSGIFGQIEGLRLDLIICDDLIDWSSTVSEVDREKVKPWFDNTPQARLEPNGRILVIGTRWHPSDLYAHIMAKPGWDCRTYKAVKDDGTALWPERFSLDSLAEKRKEMGETEFRLKFLNDAIAAQGQYFKSEWLHWAKEIPPGCRIILGVDPAITKADLTKKVAGKWDPDATAIVAIAFDSKTGIVYILDVDLQYTETTHAEAIYAMYKSWNASEAAIESNAFQALIARDAQARHPDMKIWCVEHYSKDKKARILDLQPRFQSGQILSMEGMRNKERFTNEYLSFPLGAHDDILDALEIAVKRATEPVNAVALGNVWDCETCSGKGAIDDRRCKECDGTGKHVFSGFGW